MSAIDAFLGAVLDERREFLDSAMRRIHSQSSLQRTRLTWDQVRDTFCELVRVGELTMCCALFYQLLWTDSPLQHALLRAEPDPQRKLFFRDSWLPYLERLTEKLRCTATKELEATYASYAHSLTWSWRLQRIGEHPEMPDLKQVQCIRLVNLSLPPIEHQPPGPS